MRLKIFLTLLLLFIFSFQGCGPTSSPGSGNASGSGDVTGGGTGDINGGEINKDPGTYTYEDDLNKDDSVWDSSGSNCYYDTYDFEGVSGETIKIQLSATDFSPYFLLYYEFNGDPESSDNTIIKIGQKLLLVKLTESGIYTILVRELSCSESEGDYTLIYTISE